LIEAGIKAQQTQEANLASYENKELSDEYTSFICDVIERECSLPSVDMIGFHGQTILHQPHLFRSFQLGNPSYMAERLQKDVVFDFRNNDMRHQGQGAPLAPLYHVACVADLVSPVVFVNIGGVCNITYCHKPYMGFDVGPGNCISDDICQKFFNMPFDKNGQIAEQGIIHYELIDALISQPIFQKKPPKSFDRNEFNYEALLKIKPEDAVATANYLTAKLMVEADKFYPLPPVLRIVSGGGVKNKILMNNIKHLSNAHVLSAAEIGLNPDAIEAECFAWLAVRSYLGLPLSEPSITGVSKAVSGGVLYRKC
jgi:anhydro-N-acetylmuramic acid kinase